MLWRHTLLLVVLITLSACASQNTRTPAPLNWSQHSAKLQQLEIWTASGKIALRTAQQSESATLQWQQQAHNTHLNLSGPMGLNATTMDSDGQHMSVHRGEEHSEFDVSTPDAILRNVGWDLPLQALPYWLKGMPSPAYPVQTHVLDSERDLLRTLQQDDWTIDYQAYKEFQGLSLPTRLQIQRGGTAVKIIIRDWQTGNS